MNSSTTPTTPENKQRIEKFVIALAPLICDLYGRWLDEKDFEDINQYAVPIKKQLPKGFSLVRMVKRPFGFEFEIGTGALYAITVTSSHCGWKRLK